MLGPSYPSATAPRLATTPTQVAILSQGQFNLPVAVAILAAAPNVSWANVESQASLTYVSTRQDGSASVRYDWSLNGSAQLPVKFTLEVPPWESDTYVSQGGGSFEYLPAEVCSAPCSSQSWSVGATRAGPSDAWGATWIFNFTVRLMGYPEWTGRGDFLEVDLSPVGWEGLGTQAPADLGVPAPSASDLELVQSFNTQSGPRFVFNTNGTDFQGKVFHYEPPAVRISAGSRGNLSVQLASSLQWDTHAWEAVSFSGTGGNFTVREYVDLRFGTIRLDLAPWSGT